MSQQQAIQRNTLAFAFYLFEFIISTLGTIVGLTLLLAYSNYCAANSASLVCGLLKDIFQTLSAGQVVVLFSRTIIFGLGAFKKDWLLTGTVPLKLAFLIIVPWAVEIITDNLSPTPRLVRFAAVLLPIRGIPMILYFILSYWDKALPYSYAK
jgi:hypothetical protein